MATVNTAALDNALAVLPRGAEAVVSTLPLWFWALAVTEALSPVSR